MNNSFLLKMSNGTMYLYIHTQKTLKSLQVTENPAPTPSKTEHMPMTPPPARPALPKAIVDARALNHKDEPSLESLQAEIKELRMALELFQTRHE